MTEAIEERILEFVRSDLLSGEAAVARGDDLLADGLLDSIAVLRLAAFVEETFQFKMKPADFVVENFQNVEVLADYVRRSSR